MKRARKRPVQVVRVVMPRVMMEGCAHPLRLEWRGRLHTRHHFPLPPGAKFSMELAHPRHSIAK